MFKSPFLIFIMVVSALVGAAVGFIQSEAFARIVKKTVAQKLPAEMGVQGDFSDLSIALFPPGVSIKNPRLTLDSKNIFNLPADSAISAERIDLNFLPFQMLSGNIRINEVVIHRGDVLVDFDPSAWDRPAAEKTNRRFRWDEALNIQCEAVALKDTKVRLVWGQDRGGVKTENSWTELIAESIRLSRDTRGGRAGYDVDVDLRDVRAAGSLFVGKNKNETRYLKRLSAKLFADPTGLALENLVILDDEVRIEASGSVAGNLLDPKRLDANGEVKISAELSKAIPWVRG